MADPQPFQPFVLYKRAALGDVAATRALCDAAVTRTAETEDLLSLVEGLVFARLAAARGDLGDVGRLIVISDTGSSITAHVDGVEQDTRTYTRSGTVTLNRA